MAERFRLVRIIPAALYHSERLADALSEAPESVPEHASDDIKFLYTLEGALIDYSTLNVGNCSVDIWKALVPVVEALGRIHRAVGSVSESDPRFDIFAATARCAIIIGVSVSYDAENLANDALWERGERLQLFSSIPATTAYLCTVLRPNSLWQRRRVSAFHGPLEYVYTVNEVFQTALFVGAAYHNISEEVEDSPELHAVLSAACFKAEKLQEVGDRLAVTLDSFSDGSVTGGRGLLRLEISSLYSSVALFLRRTQIQNKIWEMGSSSRRVQASVVEGASQAWATLAAGVCRTPDAFFPDDLKAAMQFIIDIAAQLAVSVRTTQRRPAAARQGAAAASANATALEALLEGGTSHSMEEQASVRAAIVLMRSLAIAWQCSFIFQAPPLEDMNTLMDDVGACVDAWTAFIVTHSAYDMKYKDSIVAQAAQAVDVAFLGTGIPLGPPRGIMISDHALLVEYMQLMGRMSNASAGSYAASAAAPLGADPLLDVGVRFTMMALSLNRDVDVQKLQRKQITASDRAALWAAGFPATLAAVRQVHLVMNDPNMARMIEYMGDESPSFIDKPLSWAMASAEVAFCAAMTPGPPLEDRFNFTLQLSALFAALFHLVAAADAADGDHLQPEGVSALMKLPDMLHTVYTTLDIALVAVEPGLRVLRSHAAKSSRGIEREELIRRIDFLIEESNAKRPSEETTAAVLGALPCSRLGCVTLPAPGSTQVQAKRCSACKLCRYCAPGCQRADWAAHKPVCQAIKRLREAAAQEASGV